MNDLYVEARRVLLDGVLAINEHRDALVLVGAQAIYLRVGDTDLAVAPYTTDGDLVIDPSLLAELPPLEQSLSEAGFRPQSRDSVGIWVTTRRVGEAVFDIAIDLLVPEAASRNATSRAADLSGHARKVARNVKGLDGALVDHDKMVIGALEDSDARSIELAVAGPAALLIAKVHKIADRIGGKRLSDKDALDVVRLLRGTPTDELADRFQRIRGEPGAKDAGERALELLHEQFVKADSLAAPMIERAVAGLDDPAELVESARALAEDLVRAL